MENKMEWNKNMQSNTIFVYNFPSEWVENDIKKNFAHFGSIAKIMITKEMNTCALVQFNESEAPQKAMEMMNGKEMNGKVLKVTLRKAPEENLEITTANKDTQTKPQSKDHAGRTTLFVFYIPPHWSDQDLYDKFKTFGNLESAKIAKKSDKSSKGYGFVVYTDPHSAALAISNMNKMEVYTGKRLKVLLKLNPNERAKKIKKGCTVFVFYLPNDWTDMDLKRHFAHYGNILGATIKREANGKSKGYGFINFEHQQSALNAVAGMNGFNAGNKYLKVSIKRGEERYIQPQYLNMDRMHNPSFTTPSPAPPPPPPLPVSMHGTDSSSFPNNELYNIPNNIATNRFNSRGGGNNDMHHSIMSQYGHFPYEYFKNNEQPNYVHRNYKGFNHMGKT